MDDRNSDTEKMLYEQQIASLSSVNTVYTVTNKVAVYINIHNKNKSEIQA